jgi:endonuclease YncB( thermonuclease family)
MLRWLVTALMAVVLLMGAFSVQAAEILQVRSGTVLQVGDHNRTYTVELACLAIPPDGDAAAAAWLRNALPRRTKVNLRPLGNADGTLVARVQRLGATGSPAENDMGAGLVAAGLASPQQGC